MKKIIAFSSVCFLIVSCSLTKPAMLQEDEMVITRKYAGNFVGYSYTQPDRLGDPHLIWIKTTMESSYGKISAYSKNCKFQPGERLYIRRIFSGGSGAFGHWTYQIESDISDASYRLSQLQSGNKTLAQSWF